MSRMLAAAVRFPARGARSRHRSWPTARLPIPPALKAWGSTAPRRSAARHPLHVAVGVGHPAEDEQQVRQPVEVLGRQRVRALRVDSISAQAARSARRATVRATCSSAAPGVPPGRMNESSLGRCALNSSHQPSSRVTYSSVTRSGGYFGSGDDRVAQVGADVEQVVLHGGAAPRDIVGQLAQGQRHADRGVALVDVGVRGDPRIGLRRPARSRPAGRAGVAGLGVDAGEVNGHGRHSATARPIRRCRPLRWPTWT